jgi:2'-5' RNA ligase
MNEWANWRKDFRYGTLVIMPSAQVRSMVDQLHAEYDPASHAWYGAHITLTQPFVRQPRENDWARLAQAAAGFDAFRIEYGPLRSFLPYPCIWFEIQPREQVLLTRRAFHDTGLFNLALPHTDDFIPHMTITEGRSGPKVDGNLLAELRNRTSEGSFLCVEVAYYVPDAGFRFTVERTLALRRN